MKITDYYQVLEVPVGASVEEIKKAYRRLALANHPDRGGTHERMLAINEAFQILVDPASRSAYDQARRDETNAWAVQKFEQDAAHAASAAGNYPRDYDEFEGWVNAMFRDLVGAKYGSEQWGMYKVPTVENSTSGGFFLLIGAVAGGYLGWKMFGAMSGGPRAFAVMGAIVGGGWVAQFLHACLKGSVSGNQPALAGGLSDPSSAPVIPSAEKKFLVICPKCEQKLRAAASRVGKQLRCPRCRHEFPMR